MNILITGVAGLLGSQLARWITDNHPEDDVFGIDDFSGGYAENIPDGVSWTKANLATDYRKIEAVFKLIKFDIVFHFAAYAAEGLSPFMRRFNYSNNIGSTMTIINECIKHDVKRLVYTSSMSIYGHGKHYQEYGHGNPEARFKEDDQPCPIDPYGISKYACEMDIQVAGVQHGLDWCIIRPHNIYGPGQNIWDRYRNVIGIWMYQSLHNQPITIYGDGTQVRAFTYIDNNLPCIYKAATSPEASKQIINLGGITPYELNYVAELVSKVTGNPNIVHLEKRHEVHTAVPTYEKSIEILDYKDSILLEEGINRMWEWAKSQPDRERMRWDKYEIDNGMYSYWK